MCKKEEKNRHRHHHHRHYYRQHLQQRKQRFEKKRIDEFPVCKMTHVMLVYRSTSCTCTQLLSCIRTHTHMYVHKTQTQTYVAREKKNYTFPFYKYLRKIWVASPTYSLVATESDVIWHFISIRFHSIYLLWVCGIIFFRHSPSMLFHMFFFRHV